MGLSLFRNSECIVVVIPQDCNHQGPFLCNSVPSVGGDHTTRAEGTAYHIVAQCCRYYMLMPLHHGLATIKSGQVRKVRVPVSLSQLPLRESAFSSPRSLQSKSGISGISGISGSCVLIVSIAFIVYIVFWNWPAYHLLLSVWF